MKKVLGISAFYHDSAAAIVIGGEIIAAAQEERFTREKNTADFPMNAITYCLEETGLELSELDAVIFYDKPLLKFERLLETYYAFSPKGIASFLKAIPVWIKEKIFLKKVIHQYLKEIGGYDKKKLPLLFSEHHLSHAASAFYASPYKKAAIVTIDGVGEWSTASIAIGDGNRIEIVKELVFPHSVGLLYSAFTYYLGFKVNQGEYKLMGLAPYGNPEAKETLTFVDLIKNNLVDLKEDGSIWMNQSFFKYATGLKMVNEKKWEQLFGFPRRLPESEIAQRHCNLALAIQKVTEEIVLKIAVEAKKITGAEYLCMAGGVALNSVVNGKLADAQVFKDIYVQPAAGDAGGALGAALAASYMYFDVERTVTSDSDSMKGAYLGPDFSDKEIERMALKEKAVYKKYSDFNEVADVISGEIAAGKIVGWFQGKMEFGPRSLGNRSILGDPRNIQMQEKINTNIKFRESFRPFAPSVLEEDVATYFELKKASPYMLFVAPIVKHLRKELPDGYFELPMKDKLTTLRSDIQAVTHVDFSSRIQTVEQKVNSRYWELIQSFKEKTGHGLLINTSFNVRSEPIVCSPEDAYQCFTNTKMDYLVIENYVFCKEDQLKSSNDSK